MCWAIIITVVLVALFVFCKCGNRSASTDAKENFSYTQVLGSLSGYRSKLNDCVNACESKNNGDDYTDEHNCLMYCQTILTKAEKESIPPSATTFDQIRDDCNKTCLEKKLPNSLSPDEYPTSVSSFEQKQIVKRCNDVCTDIAQVEQWCGEVMCLDAANKNECMKLCPSMMNPAGRWQPHPYN